VGLDSQDAKNPPYTQKLSCDTCHGERPQGTCCEIGCSGICYKNFLNPCYTLYQCLNNDLKEECDEHHPCAEQNMGVVNVDGWWSKGTGCCMDVQ